MRYEDVVPPPPHRFAQGHIVTEEGDRGGTQMRARVRAVGAVEVFQPGLHGRRDGR